MNSVWLRFKDSHNTLPQHLKWRHGQQPCLKKRSHNHNNNNQTNPKPQPNNKNKPTTNPQKSTCTKKPTTTTKQKTYKQRSANPKSCSIFYKFNKHFIYQTKQIKQLFYFKQIYHCYLNKMLHKLH